MHRGAILDTAKIHRGAILDKARMHRGAILALQGSAVWAEGPFWVWTISVGQTLCEHGTIRLAKTHIGGRVITNKKETLLLIKQWVCMNLVSSVMASSSLFGVSPSFSPANYSQVYRIIIVKIPNVYEQNVTLVTVACNEARVWCKKGVFLILWQWWQSLIPKICMEQWHKVNKENSILLYMKPNCGRLHDWSWLSFNIFCADWFHIDWVTHITRKKRKLSNRFKKCI